MVFGLQILRRVQATQGDIDGVRQIGTPICQRCSAPVAEGTLNIAGRGIRCRLAARESKFVCIKSSPRDKWRPAGPPTSLAVAMGDPIGITPRAISYRAAQAASFYRPIWFHMTLPKNVDPTNSSISYRLAMPDSA